MGPCQEGATLKEEAFAEGFDVTALKAAMNSINVKACKGNERFI